MGVPILGPSFIYGDNMSVIHNTQMPEATLKKNPNPMCCRVIRESVAMKESLTGHVTSVDNLSDIFTKVVPGGENRNHLVCKVLRDLYEC